jgi:xanthosine utilization system XapX-like protein
MLGFVVLPVVILGVLFVLMLLKKKGGETIPTIMLFPFVGMLIGNFTYHNVVDLIARKDYARFKEGSIFGYIGAVVGIGIGFVLKKKGMGSVTGNIGLQK